MIQKPTIAFALAVAFLPLSSGNALAQTQSELNQQAAIALERLDAELNVVYKKVMSILGKEDQERLKQAQRAWIAFRDAEANFAAEGGRGGSMLPMLYSIAAANLTRERINHLNAHYQQKQ